MNTIKEQQYFYDMFDEMWGSHGDIMPEEAQYSLCKELESIEHERITNALKLANGNQTRAAHLLDINRTTLLAKMKKHNII